jgi:hypothetical protein
MKTMQENGNILLVDNDASDAAPYINVDLFYTETLDGAGYLYDEWDVIDHGYTYPDTAEMQQYDAVLWFTGTRYSQCVPENAQVYLTEYLNQEGKLFIIGSEIGYNLRYSDFYHDYLHAEYLGTFNDDMYPLPVGGYRIEGESQDIIGSELSFGLTFVNIYSGYWFKPDAISPLQGASSCFFYGDSDYEYKAGIRSGVSHGPRIIYLSFGLEMIDNFNDRVAVLARSLAWILENEVPLDIDIYFPDTGIVGQSIQFSGTVEGGIPPYYSWHWNFGDGYIYQGKIVDHVYDDAGVYPVTLTVKDTANPQNCVSVQETITIEYESLLEIEEICNRFFKIGVTTQVRNSGEIPATDIRITMNITGGLRNHINKTAFSHTSLLNPEETVKLQSNVFFGFGLIAIEVNVKSSNSCPIISRTSGFLIGPFIILNGSNVTRC